MPTVVENNRIVWTRSPLVLDNTSYNDFELADGDTVTILVDDPFNGLNFPDIVIPGPSTVLYDLLMQDFFLSFFKVSGVVPGSRSDIYQFAFQDSVSCGQSWRSNTYPTSQVPPEFRFLSLASFSYQSVSWKPSPLSPTTPVTIIRPTRVEIAIQPEVFRGLYYEGDYLFLTLGVNALRWVGLSLPGGYSFYYGEDFTSGCFFSYEDIIPDGPPVHLPALPSKFCTIAPPVNPGSVCLVAPPVNPGDTPVEVYTLPTTEDVI